MDRIVRDDDIAKNLGPELVRQSIGQTVDLSGAWSVVGGAPVHLLRRHVRHDIFEEVSHSEIENLRLDRKEAGFDLACGGFCLR